MLTLTRVPGNEYLIMDTKGVVVRLKFGYAGNHNVQEVADSIFNTVKQKLEMEEQKECSSA